MIDEELLAILRCPETKEPLQLLSNDKLKLLNERIERGEVKTAEGNPVETRLEAALITEGGGRIYRIEDEIPILLVDEVILTEGLF